MTTTYDSVLSRVQIAITGLGSATTATVERSPDEITWDVVRGGQDAAVSGGTLDLDDYEFDTAVENFYRVTYRKTPTYRATGTAAHAANASVSPGLPAGHVQGDVMVAWVNTRDAAQGVPDTISGWTAIGITDCGKLLAKVHGSSESAPTFTFTGAGNANMSVSAQIACFTGLTIGTGAAVGQSNGVAAQNIDTPAADIEEDNSVVIWAGWKQDDWTSVATLAAADGEIGDTSTALGSDQGIVWDYDIQTNRGDIAASSFVVTGGATAISRALVVELLADTTTQSDSITPTITVHWLKSIVHPFLNREVKLLGPHKIGRGSRSGVFQIVGRNLPVSVNDVGTSRSMTLQIKVTSEGQQDAMDALIASGDVAFLHSPAGSRMPSLYLNLDSYDFVHSGVDDVGIYTIPAVEVAAPSADVVGATITWNDVVATYATWDDLIAANPTWNDLLDGIGDPGQVIVT